MIHRMYTFLAVWCQHHQVDWCQLMSAFRVEGQHLNPSTSMDGRKRNECGSCSALCISPGTMVRMGW